MTEPVAVSPAELPTEALRAALAGALITPGEPGYDEARRVFNAAADRNPAAIVRAAGAADVSSAVSFAREHGLELAVRGGGHSFAGHGVTDGGLMLDMSAMRGLQIDPEGRTAWAEAGISAGGYAEAAAHHGLATGFGDTGTVGVAGITLGGGMGWLTRKHGLTVDSLLAAELVTADGELIRADADSHPDLFWALRGGGGNFGVVTNLHYRLHELGTILGGSLVLRAEPGVLRSFLEVADEAPPELSTIAHLAPAPPLPFLPAELHGRLVLTVMLVWSGELEAGRRELERLRAIAPPLADTVEEMPYPRIFDIGGPERVTVAIRGAFTDGLDSAAIDTIFERMPNPDSDMSATQIRVLGGAMAAVPADATAFAHRDRRLMISVAAMNQAPGSAAALEEWADGYAAALGLPGGGAYVNYLGRGEQDRVREAYPGDTYDRLAAVKRRYDPDNLFRANHNIAP